MQTSRQRSSCSESKSRRSLYLSEQVPQLTPSCFVPKHRGRSCVPRSRHKRLSSVRLRSSDVTAKRGCLHRRMDAHRSLPCSAMRPVSRCHSITSRSKPAPHYPESSPRGTDPDAECTGSFPTGAHGVTGGEMIPRGTSYSGALPSAQCNCQCSTSSPA